jgi:DnaK suppressor protein
MIQQDDLDSFRIALSCRLVGLLGKTPLEDNIGCNRKERFTDPVDQAVFEADQRTALRIMDRERRLILKIQASLKRIEDGDYGTCVICGNPISLARLKARPVTIHCIGCKVENEGKERMGLI